jgi:hypothetical protein
MSHLQDNAIPYFQRWYAQPIGLSGGESVRVTMDALNAHPLVSDAPQDYITHPERYSEFAGRFEILGENQDVWHCFVAAGSETQPDPPVFFESCLGLRQDYGFSPEDIQDVHGACVEAGNFRGFLWNLLGRHICLRVEGAAVLAPGVQGCGFAQEGVLSGALGEAYFNPLGRAFPDGYTCYFAEDTICIPKWGAAFLHAAARECFMTAFAPAIQSTWAR